jgi:hypothetical protein
MAMLAMCWLGTGDLFAQEAAGGTAVLDTSGGFWRVFYTLRQPVVRDGQNLRKLATLAGDSPDPAANWTALDFDDGDWTRITGKCLPAADGSDNGVTGSEGSSPALAMICLRGKFGVTDPAAVKDLKLSVRYRGGVVVYLNGKEVGRSDMPKNSAGPEALAEDYPKEAFLGSDGSPLLSGRSSGAAPAGLKARVRQADIAIPAQALSKGANVLAIAVHRAAYLPALKEWTDTKKTPDYMMYSFLWATCGLHSARLTSASPAGLTPNLARPKGLQVWNSQPMQQDFDLDYGDPFEPLRPVKLVGTRGGVVSGKVVLGSDQDIKGLKAQISELTAKAGAKIAASAVKVRYALPNGHEPVAATHYPSPASMFDGLSDTPPGVVEVRGKGQWPLGAVCPVWVTVAVPADAVAGDYSGKLTISADGAAKPIEAAVELKVCNWLSPKPNQFRTIVDFIESPETVAMQYDAPLYGEQHFKLLEKSFERMGYVGNWTVHIPLICQTNMGNDQSMVRWIKKPDGTYKYDFTVFDTYLDVAEKQMGKPRIVFIVVWDYFVGIAGQAMAGLHPEIKKVLPQTAEEVPVSVLDEATGKVTMETVGRYDAAGKAKWKALATEMMDHLRKRGLDRAMVLGTVDDVYPTNEIVAFWKELLPDATWGRYAHYDWQSSQNGTGPPVGYQAHAYLTIWGIKPMQGWKRPDKTVLFFRTGGFGDLAQADVSLPMDLSRLLGEINIQGPRRGFGRVGLDFWPVIKNARGQAVISLQGRFPKSFWRQLDMMVRGFVPPGPDGAMATAKLEMMREGLQETEARIFLEMALDGKRLSGPLADKAQQVLDERVRALAMAMENQPLAGFSATNKPWLDGYGAGDFHASQGAIFRQWYMESGWQGRSERLFTVAAEVAQGVK